MIFFLIGSYKGCADLFTCRSGHLPGFSPQGQEISIDHQNSAWSLARAGTPRNILNPFIDEEIGTRSWDLILGLNPKSINLGTTVCGSLSLFGSC